MTTLEEFYKVGPGPSSSHTIGPMRITYDFYQRCTKLPADQLAKATALRVHLFGSLSATGKGHGTERAALAGIIGKEPATINPLFLDELAAKPDQTFPVKLGSATFNVLAQGHHLRRTEGQLPASEHDDVQAAGGRQRAARAGVLLGRRRVHRMEGLSAAEEGRAEISVRHDEGAAGARGQEQALDRAAGDGERSGGVRQERGGDQRVPRQDLDGDGQHRQVGSRGAVRDAARADQAEDQGRGRLQAGHGRQVRSAARRRRRGRVRAGRFGGERARPPGRDGADRRVGRRDARGRVRAGRGRPQVAAGEDPRRAAGRRGHRLPVQTQRDAGRTPKAAARRRSAWPRRWPRH